MLRLPMRGRAVPENPPNRFERVHCTMDPEEEGGPGPTTEFIPDKTIRVLAENKSPDVPFDVSLNAYRGCEHGCVYCYARPTHEYLGFSSGLDFEQKILVKHRAPELLREALSKKSWKPRVIGMSGVTDPYQPAERRFKITRRCLEVLRDFRNPVNLITKNHLVTRDVDLLAELAESNCVHVTVSITSLDRTLQRVMEPRTSVPSRRLRAIETLAKAGVSVGVNLAPIIPGLNDQEVPQVLEASRDAGATCAAFILLRLPLGVADHFENWLSRHFPERKSRVLNQIKAAREGALNDSAFFARGRGKGPYAKGVGQLFKVAARKTGLDQPPPALSPESFRRHGGDQGDLFF